MLLTSVYHFLEDRRIIFAPENTRLVIAALETIAPHC